jgi:sulfite reductase (NADPH) flavoprotein alpha-component
VFYYFGYGSNLSVVSLRAKGVDPLTSEAATLAGWRLAFDIPDFFRIEGGTGNIERCDGDQVHGVLHGCRSRDLRVLDQLEAVGTRYQRVETTIVTYSGRPVRAYVYIGLESVLDGTLLPSERYKNILLKGATDMSLDADYLERLRSIRTCPRPEPVPFIAPEGPSTWFTLAQLETMKSCVALDGHVFDMSEAAAPHAYLRQLLGGRDATLLFLKRMDTSTGNETLDDVTAGRLTDEQHLYITTYLHEFAREYRHIGCLEYPVPEASPTATASRPPSRSRPSWAPPRVEYATTPSGVTIESRAVLDKAEAAHAELRHENLGFLSQRHGYMPVDLPREAMPKAYAAWDQIAAELPELYRSLTLRRRARELPVLRADEENLPDDALLRAALLLGMLSHAYHYTETAPPDRHPESLSRPWAEVRRRLGRGPAVLTYQDLIVYNFRLIEPSRPDPMALSNLRLLVPTVDNAEERTFYLTQTQILSHASPIVGAVVRAQEAVVCDDAEAIESALMTIIACLQRIVRESLLNINPNPHATPHVDPVVWAKTVAPFAVPMQAGVQGPSGTSSPIFNTLDVFFGRKRYETFLGREIHALRDTYPPLWREFLAALQAISVPDYIEMRGKPHLKGLLNEARSVYAGPNGFLGRHRMKVYGYLELAFKVGRSVTIGGFHGVFKDRTWDQVDAELEKSRVERVQSFPQSCYHARAKSVTTGGRDGGDAAGVFDIVLDVSGTGLRYEAGDRCGVLPENTPELITRTLNALGATGDERIALSNEWKDAIRLRYGYDGCEEVSLVEILRFGQIRPLHPRAAEALHAMTQSEILEQALRTGDTKQWELCDALEMLSRWGVALLAPPKASVGVSAHRICEIVPPENFRMYSISSVITSAETQAATELRLTVAPLRYEGRNGRPMRGVASSFLTSLAGRTEPISILIEHPARFALPRDAKTPLVMIAGGTGVAPFRGFISERRRQLAPAETWLILGVRSRDEIVGQAELADTIGAGELKLSVAFSRDDIDLVWDTERSAFTWAPGKRRYVTDLLREDENARMLWELVRPIADGGKGAHVYVCGRTRFAKAAIAALRDVIEQFAEGTAEERRRYATKLLNDLSAQGRFMQEIFSGEAAAGEASAIDISEIVRHNDEENGYWFIIDGRVYDLTEYIRLHPGGMRILEGYAGMDASDGYARAHHARTEIDATREMYAIGVVRRLNLKGTSVTIQRTDGTEQVVALGGAYRAWVRSLFLVVEMQNALRNDHTLQAGITTRDDPPLPRSLYKLQKAVETHRRFLRSYIDGLTSESLPNLWTLTYGLSGSGEERNWMNERLARIAELGTTRFVNAMASELEASIALLADGPGDDALLARVTHACEVIELEALRCLRDVKNVLREGVHVFEELESLTFDGGIDPLLAACRRLPEVLVRYYGSLTLRLRREGSWHPEIAAENSDRDNREATLRVLACSKYWFMEEHFKERVVVLCRTPIPFESLSVLVKENEAVLALIRQEHSSYGVIVDMRQAPARNDPAFEGAMRHLRETLTMRFARLAVLIESAAGVLQVNRLGRGEGQRHFATMSESAAMKFAKGET